MSYRVPVTFESLEGLPDDYNETEADWRPFCNARCDFRTLQGRELVNAQQNYAKATAVFKTWADPSITPEMRIKVQKGSPKTGATGTWNIAAIVPDDDSREMMIFAAR